jgi:methionine biosynthesis protein MetW
MTSFDTRGVTDNRGYDYTQHPETPRAEHPLIVSWVPEGARVLDLGCGNGTLLALLRSEKRTRGCGVEISESGVAHGRAKGLDVRQGRIDAPLPWPDDAFDVSVCNVTIQMLMYPEVLLREMRRLAPVAIVSFANFAFVRNRIDYLLSGRMPRPMLYGYKWYETGHIHQLSLLDFFDLCAEVGLRLDDARYRRHRNIVLDALYRRFPNVFTSIPILKLARVGR